MAVTGGLSKSEFMTLRDTSEREDAVGVPGGVDTFTKTCGIYREAEELPAA
jgi:hypothetical protein